MTGSRLRTRFTLRETILFITAISSVMALGVALRPSHPTDFFLTYNPQDVMSATLKSLGNETVCVVATGGPSTSLPTCRNMVRLCVSTDSLTGQEVFAAFVERTLSLLKDRKCNVCSERQFDGLAFAADYLCGTRTGRVCAFGYILDKRLWVIVVVDEGRL